MEPDAEIENWLRRAAAGDALALQKLLLAHHDRLRALAEGRLSPELRAVVAPEDLLQQVYVRALEAPLEDRGPRAFFAWLVRILEGRLVDAHRTWHAARRDRDREVRAAEAPSRFGELCERAALDTTTPSRVFSRREEEALVMAALAGLSADHRRVLELRYLEGLSLAETGRRMSRSAEAVQMLAARAVRRLRDGVRQLSGTG